MEVRRHWNNICKVQGKNPTVNLEVYMWEKSNKAKIKNVCLHTTAAKIHQRQTWTLRDVKEVLQAEGK